MSIILILHTILMALTFGNFELLTVDYHSIDTPIAELNNHTLREVFEDNNLNPISVVGVQNTVSIIDDYVNIINSSTDLEHFASIRYNTGVLLLNEKLYINFETKNISSLTTQLRYFIESGNPYQNSSNILTNVGYNSFIYTRITSDITTFSFFNVSFRNSDENVTYQIYIPKVINMSYLGISTLTVEQMDYWFSVYQENIGADDVTYVINEHDMTDLIILLGFSFIWVGIFWVIRKVVL